MVVGLLTGEAQLEPHRLLAVVPAFAYLVAVPSIIGFVLFAWLLSRVPVHIANIAVYVAPDIVLGLGWRLLGEEVTPRTLSGVGIIIVGVVLIDLSGSRSQRTAVAEPKPSLDLERRAA